ncbi:MAG: O-methyltransferase [Calditrichaeota bacterium]|nr:O-methyltransferase [Calditrichota bacterium]
MHILDPELEKYILNLMPPLAAVLQEMTDYGNKKNFPIIGPLCGQFLRQMAVATNAKNIFEMGSGFGYSAIWFSLGLADDGKIICTDGDEKNKRHALKYFQRLAIEDKIEFHVGQAQDILQQFDGPFDIIFNDVDKEQYPETIDLVVPRLRRGGLFITDNALWSGKVLQKKGDMYTEGVKEFNKRLFSHPELATMIVPLRDGLAVSVRL